MIIKELQFILIILFQKIKKKEDYLLKLNMEILIYIKHTINNYNLGCDVNFFIDSMNKAAETLKALLKVRKNFVINKITDDNITELQIDYWNSSIIGSKANYLGDLGIDFLFWPDLKIQWLKTYWLMQKQY